MAELEIRENPFSYDAGLYCKGQDYTLRLPDGFVVAEDAERDFVAYLGGDGVTCAEDSPFAIYAGKLQSHELFKGACIPQVYESFAYAITCNTSAKHTFENLAFISSENPEAPGGISAGYDKEDIYYNAYLGFCSAIHPLRIDVSCPPEKRSECDAKVIDLINHIEPDTKAKYLEMPGDDLFINYGVGTTLAELWDGNINDNIKQMTLARNIRQGAMVNMYKEQQSRGMASISVFKEDITEMLSSIVHRADETIKSAERAYDTFCAETDDPELIAKFKASLTKLLDFAKQSVVISGEELCVVSELAEEVRRKINGEPKVEPAPERNDDFIFAVTTEDDSEEGTIEEEAPEIVMARKEAALAEFEKTKRAELVREYKGRYEEATAVLKRAMKVAQAGIEDTKDSLALLPRNEYDKKEELTLRLEEKEERLYQLQVKEYELKKKYIEAVKTLPDYLEQLKAEFKASLDKE